MRERKSTHHIEAPEVLVDLSLDLHAPHARFSTREPLQNFFRETRRNQTPKTPTSRCGVVQTWPILVISTLLTRQKKMTQQQMMMKKGIPTPSAMIAAVGSASSFTTVRTHVETCHSTP